MTPQERKVAHSPGVQVQTVFGWRYLGVYSDRKTAEQVAEEARESGKYLRVRIK